MWPNRVRITLVALALGIASTAAGAATCDSSLTGTWITSHPNRVRIIDESGRVEVFLYSLGPDARRSGRSLYGGRSGDVIVALDGGVPFPAGLSIAIRSCELLEARWFSSRPGGSEGRPFALERQSAGYCGDGVLGLDEECDDGNFRDRDACTVVCQLARCGDGVRDVAEECDDGDRDDRDGCSATCNQEAPRFPKICPDLSGTWRVTNDTYHGGPWTVRHSRDGSLEAVVFTPWSADLIASRVAFTGRERNGHIELLGLARFFEREVEIRLAGSALGCDRIELQGVGPLQEDEILPLHVLERESRAYCGDGSVAAAEQCDDGNLRPGDGCSFACTLPVCGDGLVDPGEDCDPGEFSWDETCAHCTRDAGRCEDLTGTWQGTGSTFIGKELNVDGLHLSLVDDGRGGLRGAVAGDALGERSDLWLSLEGAHGVGVIWLATSVRTTVPLNERVHGLEGVLSGTLESCDAFGINGATFRRISTGICGDGRREGAERCDDGNMQSGDGCSASCTRERKHPGRAQPRLPFLARR